MERLDKFLCSCTAYTRSQIRQVLKSGRVTVDGETIRDGSVKIDRQRVCLDGEPLGVVGTVVLMLNKPAGYVTATEDRTEKTVMELLPVRFRYMDLKPVGRLDKATEGLLLFTNDGDLLHRLISPKKEVPKVYYARHEGSVTDQDILEFSEGLILADGTKCLPARLESVGVGESLVTVCEGKYHQVRRMMASRNLPVLYLERRKEGALELGDLPRGEVRLLSDEEVESLMQNVR